jgi:hypothetical protein
MEATILASAAHGQIERLRAFMEAHPLRLTAADFPTEHRFTPGLYSRTVLVAEGRRVLSRVHLTHHQFVISKGVAKVWSPGHGLQVVQSPHLGITLPGTRRAVEALSDVIWTTFHANPDDCRDMDELERRLFA